MYAYVGCYTSPDRGGRGEGIGIFRVDPASGEWRGVGVASGVANPSFLALHPDGNTLYCVHGGNDHSRVSAFARDRATGALTLLNSQPSGGRNPVHLSFEPTGRLLVVANYTEGTVAALPVAADGTLRAPGRILKLTGTLGPDPVEQASPHPHHSPYDPAGGFVVVPDKGLDALFVYRPDVVSGTIAPHEPPSVATNGGAGPRHIAFAPNAPYAYVINELDSTVTTYAYDAAAGTLEALQTISSLPDDFTGKNSGAEIEVAPSGRFVYLSNRGHDSIGVFAVSAHDGTLTPRAWTPTGGATPRFFALDPAGIFLYAANQDSDTIVTFRVDAAAGRLTATGQVVSSGSPCCIVFADA
ncbi:MAG TPA: lactonase family protein [Thermomicrobiales bacterium]|jgi:6-phosphogluconolactonase (cycloisomerase 2 family)